MKKIKLIIKILSFAIVIVLITHVVDIKIQKNEDSKKAVAAHVLANTYETQNNAFGLPSVLKCYVPFSCINKNDLDKILASYEKAKGITVTEFDVQIFLRDPKLENETPKTYLNSGNQKIYDFVIWADTIEMTPD